MSATIGIANSASDYQTLPNASASPTPSSSTFTTGISNSPATNQVYRWAPNCPAIDAASSTPACSGTTLSLYGNVTSGTATGYAWAGPGGYSSTLQNPTITGITTAQAGVYTFTATNSGCTVTDTTTVVVDSTPTATISGTTAICTGGSGSVTFTGIAGATVYYQVNGGATTSITLGAGGTATVSSTLTTGSTVTTYTYTLVSATLGACSQTLTGSAVITVNPAPPAITGSSSVCIGSTISLANAAAGGTWTSGSASVATVTGSGGTATVTGVSTGTANITYTLGTGCYIFTTVTVNALPGAITGATAVCVGSAITLGGTPSGGTWTSGTTSVATAGSSSGIVTGVAPGTSVITYTLSTGCSITSTITVNSLPSAIGGPSSVCDNATITLTATPAGGAWSSSAVTRATVDPSTGVVSGVSAGTATITYTVGSSCYSTKSITVNAAPAAISGPSAVCVSQSISLGSSPAGGTWTSGSTGIATVSGGGVVTGVSAGGAIVTYTVSSGCYVTDSITINPLPGAIVGDTEICPGSATLYTATGGSGTWSSTRGRLSYSTSTGLVTASGPGRDTLVFTLSATGCSVTLPVLIDPLPAAITGPSAVCEAGSVITLTDATPGGTWSSGSSVATVDAGGNVTGVSAGTADITYTITTTGCMAVTTITVNPLPAAISGSANVCLGSSITLSDATGGGTWSSSNTGVATIDAAGVVTGVSAGTADITYTLSTGCYITTTVTVNSLPGSVTGTTTVCSGLSTTLSNTVSGGAWSSSNTSIATVDPATGAVTGVAGGTATITYALGSGCIATTSFLVNQSPAAIAGVSNVCFGYTAVYTDATAGGTWSTADASIASISGGGVVTGVATGTTTITYTSSNGCIASASVTVDPLPATITGATAVCVGAQVGLSNTTAGGIWTSTNTAIATVDPSTGVVTGVATGTVNIRYTLVSGCFIAMSITVNPLPAAITGAGSVCEFSSVTLSDATASGSWTSSSTSIATVGPTTGVVTGVLAGTTTISYSLPTGCYVTHAFSVNPTPMPVSGPSEVCEGGSVITLTDATAGGTWTTSNAALASINAATGVVTGVSAGSVTITYTRAGCFVTTTITVRPLPGAIITPIGDTMMCPGDFVVLTSTTGTGYTYQWYTGASAITGETDPYYITYTGANYSIAITSAYGCTSVSPPVSVTVNPALAIATAAGTTTFCTGSGVTLNANTGAGLTYQWMVSGSGISGATGATFVAGATGSYSVVVTNAAGCSATSTGISVLAMPAPPATLTLSGPVTFCNGDSLVMTADTGAALTYQWQLGGVDIAGATNIFYTTLATGNYRVVETNGAACSLASATVAVTVLALPPAAISAAGSTTFCIGGSVTLSTATGAGNTYQWLRGGAVITGATNANYIASISGNYQVRVTPASGCIGLTPVPVTVTKIDVPTVVPVTPLTFCWGGGALLGMSVSASTGVSYQWQRNGIDIPGATNATYSAAVSGNYSAIVSIAGGCTIGSVAVTVTQLPLPNPIVTRSGTHLVTGNYYTSYQWYNNATAIGSATSWSVIPAATGDYTVRVTDTNGCQSVSSGYNLTSLATTGIGTISHADILIYPNPAQDVIHIVAGEALTAVISSVDGRGLLTIPAATTISISALAPGVYMLQLYNSDGFVVKTERVVKE